jgi:hypothetical protein
MKGKCGVIAPKNRVKHPDWDIGFVDKGGFRYPAREIKIKRGGQGRISGSGPSGYKMNPAKLLSRSLAERTGANLAAKTRQEARIKAKAIPLKML